MSTFIPPDWRDASAYPATYKDLYDYQWAWEFLRRNPEYQKDYEHFASLPDYCANGAKTAKWHCTQAMWWDDPRLRYCKQPVLPDEDTIAEYFHRTKDDTPFHYSLEDYFLEKWGIHTEMHDPSYGAGDQCLSCEPELPKELHIYNPETHPELSQFHPIKPDSMFETTLRFDLRYSVEKQLEEAKKILMSYKEGLKENYLFPDLKNEIVRTSKSIQPEKLPQYLRAYDGRQSGATFSYIGEVIFRGGVENVGKQRAYKASEKAEELVQGGYRELMKYE
ncbi:MAG: DUF6499 domain-containing protein [Nitrosomonas sp.]|uniref:transcriptional regulator domain-containing protein n=1 Tax=Nitrosomonas sp. TaxID=42353 RepID=UPI0027336EC5|nr:DUF6499 domain-containing protein [Nitrosomonas sp.]MDP3279955.1 DUF6499 domain-containing protein [Nitrosomonas sp.]MDP3663842.1 DUF6499 domain-containing protein [Nitrosomonas sp.]MDZ4105660.1 DUF6499 domain-containing protein [Nitrosomonas sp.]